MDAKEKQNGILEGVIWKQLLIFFFPILVGTFFQQLYNTVDTVIVGQFAGKEALSSVGGSSAQIINMVVGFFTPAEQCSSRRPTVRPISRDWRMRCIHPMPSVFWAG